MSPTNQTVSEGKITYISCTATGVPKPTLSWTFKDASPPKAAIIKEDGNGSFLQLPNTAKGMEGKYKCTARNKAAEAIAFSTLRVIGKSYFLIFIISRFVLYWFQFIDYGKHSIGWRNFCQLYLKHLSKITFW